MKRLVFAILTLGFYSCIAQNSTLPISFTIKTEREYFITKEKDYYSREIRQYDYVVNSDSVKQKYFDITVEIKNIANKSISIWLMSCSFHDNFIINNNYISMAGRSCDKNHPVQVKLLAGESKKYKLTLLRSIKFDYPSRYSVYGQQVEFTKLGLIVVDDIFENRFTHKDNGYRLAMEDKSKWTIIWSNPLQLLGKQPEPKTIPIKGN